MKESYLPELSEMYQKIATKLQQHDSLPHQPKSDQLEKLKVFKMMLERLITFLQVSKSNISPSLKEKLGSYEKQIINFINTNRPRKLSSLQPGHLPPPHIMSQTQSQVTQVQPHENQMNNQLQATNMQGPGATMQQNNNNMTIMQYSSLSGVSTAQQNMINIMQPSASLDSGQGNMSSLQQVPVSSLQQKSVTAPQQTNVSSLSSQAGVNVIQQNLNPLQPASAMLQHQQLKHQQEQQQMLQSQQFKQNYQRQPMQRQQMLQQQLHQPAKQQLPAQLQTHQLQQHQMNDVTDMKMRQGIGVKQVGFQQHI
ncbi:mediator of RNA polymerase II transcription subunit 15A-like, partial [Trifolium medium]|nr:mediator of RNA polymerase II transcription subunit 15A-like [Trifolium medium]